MDASRIYTAITAKGLEFKATILYKFGEDPAASLFGRIMAGEILRDESERYQLAHFFTKLYIAISRAKQVLFIVDSDESYEKFWKYFVDKDLWKHFLQKYVTKNTGDLGNLSFGDISDFGFRLAENYKPKEYAESLFKNAIDEEDPETMNRARSAYKEAKYEDKANLCKAYIHEFKKEYSEAGKRFEELGESDLALNAYWKGHDWEHVLRILKSDTFKCEDIAFKRAVATFLSGRASLLDFMKDWKDNEDIFQDSLASPKDRELWLKIARQIEDAAKKIPPKDITRAQLQYLDRFSDYLDWYEHGLAALRAALHFKRAEFDNRGLEKTDPEFHPSDYEAAIECWDALPEKSNTKDYCKAKKLVSKTASDEIFWMSKLDETDSIISQYGNPDFADNLTENAKNIVFNCLATKNIERAIAYPYPKDVQAKWNVVYSKDKFGFLRKIILKDFSLDKFEFLQSKLVETIESDNFKRRIPDDILDSIFSLNGADANDMPYWIYFLKELKDCFGKRILKDEMCRDAMLDSLGRTLKLKEETNKPIASCFLEMLFDEQYNFGRAKKHIEVIASLFKYSDCVFSKKDFRLGERKNKYFTEYCDFTTDDVDRIKGNLHSFAYDYIRDLDKVNSKINENIVKPMLYALETSVAYNNAAPDYSKTCKSYRNILNNKDLKKRYSLIWPWIERRYFFNGFLSDSDFQHLNEAFNKNKDNIGQFINTLNKEDSIAFVSAVADGRYCFSAIILAAESIYSKQLKKEDFYRGSSLGDKIFPMVDDAVKELLEDKKHVKEYEIKLLTFVWESFGTHSAAAGRYDKLVSHSRLEKISRLRNYFRRRALLHYYYSNADQFDEKRKEYGILMDKNDLPSWYPNIVRENSDSSNTDGDGAAAAIDPAKAKALEIARNMKVNGMPDELIATCTGLTKEEIERL